MPHSDIIFFTTTQAFECLFVFGSLKNNAIFNNLFLSRQTNTSIQNQNKNRRTCARSAATKDTLYCACIAEAKGVSFKKRPTMIRIVERLSGLGPYK